MPALLPETHQRIQQYHETFWRNGLPALSYQFSDLPPSGRLTYELVNWTNIETYLDLFGDDPNPYVMDDFKTRSDLEQYAVFDGRKNTVNPVQPITKSWLIQCPCTPLMIW